MLKHTKYDNATVQPLNGALIRENLPLRFARSGYISPVQLYKLAGRIEIIPVASLVSTIYPTVKGIYCITQYAQRNYYRIRKYTINVT